MSDNSGVRKRSAAELCENGEENASLREQLKQKDQQLQQQAASTQQASRKQSAASRNQSAASLK
jgi:hypothetical protein